MKILFYTKFSAFGGAERVIANVANMFAQNGHEVIFVVGVKTDNEHEMHSKIKVIYLNQSKELLTNASMGTEILRTLKPIFTLRKILKKERPDVMITFVLDTIVQAVLATRSLPISLIVSLRIDPTATIASETRGKRRKFVLKYFFPFADGLIFQTEEARDYFSEKIKSKSVIISNLVDARFFDIKASTEKKDIVGVGRLIPRKNWKLAIKAFSLIACDTVENLVIYGDGVELENLQEYARQLDLSDRVIFAGTSNEIGNRLANARLFVFSTDYEGVPNALIEAMILGVPCVSTMFDGGSYESLIENGVNGILVPKNNAEAMAEAMRKILSDKDYAESLGRNAKIKAEDFRPEKVFKQWEEYITSYSRRL